MSSKKILAQGLPWFIIATGLLLRLDQYLFNRSLWLDEAFLATPLVQGSWFTLITEPLEYGHVLPAGFVLGVKLSLTLFGNSDFILRLFPFLCSVTSLLLFYYVAKRAVSPVAVPIALVLFAVAESLVFYASELKPYSTDVLVTLTLLAVVYSFQSSHLKTKQLILLTVVGIIALWFSYIAVIVLASIGSYLGFSAFLNKQWPQLFKLISVGFIWVGNFLLLYFVVIGGDPSSLPVGRWVMAAWVEQNAFMPASLIDSLAWLYHTFLKTLDYPVNFKAVKLGGVLVVIGMVALFFQHKKTAFLILLPVVIALLTAYLQKYPFFGRMILFLVPLTYLAVAEGIAHLRIDLGNESKMAMVANLGVPLIVFSFLIDFGPIRRLALEEKMMGQEIKPVLNYVQQHRQAEDVIYLYFWVEPAFRYYASAYGFNAQDCHLISPIPPKEHIKEVDHFRIAYQLQPVPVQQTQCVLGISEVLSQAQSDLDRLKGRVWFIFSHTNQEKPSFLGYLERRGSRLNAIEVVGASGYLYHLPMN